MMVEFEYRRKAFHIVMGFALVFLVYYKMLTPLVLFGIIIFGLLLSFLSMKYTIPFIQQMLDYFEREKNLKHFPGKGSILFICGTLFVVTVFEQDIAIASLIILTLGDGISPLIGMRYGKIKHPFSDSKFIEGHVVGALAALIGVMMFVWVGFISVTFWEAFFASIVAMIAEGIDFSYHIDIRDDNFIVPVVAGSVMWLMRIF